MSAVWIAGHLATLLIAPFLITGVVNRTKSIWAGRRGPPILQSLWDVRRLLRKRAVYSSVTTSLVRSAPWIVFATMWVSAMIAPLVTDRAPLSFALDFVFFAYAWALARIFLVLGALDTGSAFEGMGASREATYGALVEPALFLVAGTLALLTGHASFASLLHVTSAEPAALAARVACFVALFVFLQVEAARIPVDDPSTHLELTMIHEVMILDHGGPDLGAYQWGAAIKLTVLSGLLATLANPFSAEAAPGLFAVANIAGMLVIAVLVGTVESVVARLKFRVVPHYVLVAIAAALVALLASAWPSGGEL